MVNFVDAALYGTITPITLEGVPYVVSVTEHGMTLILVSNTTNPKVVMGASIPSIPSGEFGSTSPGVNVLYTSLIPDNICVVDLVSQTEASCKEHEGTPRSMDAITAEDVLYLASAADTPGVSIRTESLNQTLFVDTNRAPSDIRTVYAYGAVYTLAAAGDLYTFDMSGEPVYKEDGPYISLDTAKIDDSVYAVLLDTDGTVHIMNLSVP